MRKTRRCPRVKGFRRFDCCLSDGCCRAPKPGAIPTSLYPDIHFSAMIPRRTVKIKFFLSVVIPVVKAAFVPFSARGRKPRKRRRRKALRRFASPYPGYRHGTPKAGALPTAQHPVMKLGDPAGRILPMWRGTNSAIPGYSI